MKRYSGGAKLRQRGELGASLAELVFVFPLFATIMMATIDGVQMLGAHIALTRTTYEAVRLASQTAGLELGVYGSLGTPPVPDSAHAVLQARVAELVGGYDRQLEGVSVSTARYDTYSAGGEDLTNVVKVDLEMQYHPLMQLFGPVPLRTSNVGPYLFKS